MLQEREHITILFPKSQILYSIFLRKMVKQPILKFKEIFKINFRKTKIGVALTHAWWPLFSRGSKWRIRKFLLISLCLIKCILLRKDLHKFAWTSVMWLGILFPGWIWPLLACSKVSMMCLRQLVCPTHVLRRALRSLIPWTVCPTVEAFRLK